MADQVPSPPKASKGDIAHSTARALLGSIPTVGNAVVEFFQLLLGPPLERRRQEWFESVAEGINKLNEQQKCVVDDLCSNDKFIDTFMQASQAAVRTSQQEKREALRNAVMNAAVPHSPDESRQHIFVNWIDSLSVWHLRMARLFASPRAWYRANNRQPQQFFNMSSRSQVLIHAYPELANEQDFCNKLAKDLHNEGLLGTDNLKLMMSGHGAMDDSATPIGEEFMKFISDPTQ